MTVYYDRFDIVEAYYCFLMDYYESSGSKKYWRLSRMLRYFRPRPMLTQATLSDNGKAIYRKLETTEKAKTKAERRRKTCLK